MIIILKRTIKGEELENKGYYKRIIKGNQNKGNKQLWPILDNFWTIGQF